MTTVVLVRHGQSLGNAYSMFLGHTDLGLSPVGKRQAEEVAAYLDRYSFDRLYASDLLRAVETATPTALRQKLTVETDEALREIYAGEWEKRTVDDIRDRYPEAYRIWSHDIGHATPTGGESVCALSRRIFAAFDRIVADNPDKTVLVVTHGTPIRLLTCRFLLRDVSFAATVPFAPNASVTTVTVDCGRYTLSETGYDGFLSDKTNFTGHF